MKSCLFLLLFASQPTCSAQAKYLKVTTDSSLAFRLAFANFQGFQKPYHIAGCNSCDLAFYGGLGAMATGAIVLVFGAMGGIASEAPYYGGDCLLCPLFIAWGLTLFIPGVVLAAIGGICRYSWCRQYF